MSEGAKIWLQEPWCGCRSHDGAAGAKIWLSACGIGSWSNIFLSLRSKEGLRPGLLIKEVAQSDLSLYLS